MNLELVFQLLQILAIRGALAEFAHEAEAAGWDGFFIWDAMFFDPTFHPMADPWVRLQPWP